MKPFPVTKCDLALAAMVLSIISLSGCKAPNSSTTQQLVPVAAARNVEEASLNTPIIRHPVPVAADEQRRARDKLSQPLTPMQVDRLLAALQAKETRLAALSELLNLLSLMTYGGFDDDPVIWQPWSKAKGAVISLADIKAIVSHLTRKLEQPAERVGALATLIRIASFGPQGVPAGIVFGSGEPIFDKAATEARLAAHRAVTPGFIAQLLKHPDRDVRVWAVGRFGDNRFVPDAWKPWLPHLEHIATEDEEWLRCLAVERLNAFPSSRKFLHERLEREPSPYALRQLVLDRHGSGPEFEREFVALFYPLLTHPDTALRVAALTFISAHAPSNNGYHFPYDRRTFDRVAELTKSNQATERAAAIYALARIQAHDRDLSRRLFLAMARDPEAEVRGNAARALVTQKDNPEAKAALAQLLKDESPMVQWWTIIMLGPDPFEEQLKALASGPDKAVARLAKSSLNGIAYRKGLK